MSKIKQLLLYGTQRQFPAASMRKLEQKSYLLIILRVLKIYLDKGKIFLNTSEKG